MLEVIGKVTKQEKDELLELYEKKGALENLKVLNLEEAVGKKIDKDLEDIQCLMQDWWQSHAEKYSWKGKGSNKHWEISFLTGEIILV